MAAGEGLRPFPRGFPEDPDIFSLQTGQMRPPRRREGGNKCRIPIRALSFLAGAPFEPLVQRLSRDAEKLSGDPLIVPWTAWAISSFPTPVSPVIRRGWEERAIASR